MIEVYIPLGHEMNCVSLKFICWSWLPVTVYGDRPFIEVIKVKGGHKGGALILHNLQPIRRVRDPISPLHIFLSLPLLSHTRKRSCVLIIWNHLSVRPQKRPHKINTYCHFDLELLRSKAEKTHRVVQMVHLVYGILVELCSQTNIFC